MKRIMTIYLMSALFFLLPVLLWGECGGPDAYGYVWCDDREAMVEFDWVDTAGATRLSGSSDVGDDIQIEIIIPFTFRFYGRGYNLVYVTDNGLLTFSDTSATSYLNQPVPHTNFPNNAVYPHWDDGRIRGSEGNSWVFTKMQGSSPSRRFTIIWSNIYYPYSDVTNPLSFEVTLYECSEGDGEILIQYLDVESASDDNSFGRSATIGVENINGIIGLQYSYNDSTLRNNMALKFSVPSFHYDAGIMEINLPAGIGLVGIGTTPRMVCRNNGEYEMINIPGYLVIQGEGGESIYSDTVVFDMFAGSTDTVSFREWVAAEEGSVMITAFIDPTLDVWPVNDTLRKRSAAFIHYTEGGPDSLGYLWKDSYHPGGPEYTPVSISGAFLMGLYGDDNSISIPLPFPFHFYRGTYDTVYASTNGFISFLPLTVSGVTNYCFPASAVPNALITGLWDDMNFDTTLSPRPGLYTKVTGLIPERKFHIIYKNAYLPFSSTTETVTFEIVLYEDGRIKLNYADVETPSASDHSFGKSATVGIEDQEGMVGLAYQCENNPPSNPLFPEFAIMFYPPDMVDLSGPVINHTPPDMILPCMDPLVISARISDESGVGLDSLCYSIGANPYISVGSDSSVGEQFYYTLTGFLSGQELKYYFKAQDLSEALNWSSLPYGAPGNVFRIMIRDPHFFGPGPGGYYYVDSYSDSAWAPLFEWIEIDPSEGGDGYELDIDDDEISEVLTFSSAINYFGTLYYQLRVAMNGWLTFNTALISDPYVYNQVPSPGAPNLALYPWWCDLIRGTGAIMGKVIFYEDTRNDRIIIEWKNVINEEDVAHPVSFQVVLLGESHWNPDILFNFLDIEASIPEATIGMENVDGTEGLQYFHDLYPLTEEGIPGDSMTVLFRNPTLGLKRVSHNLPVKFEVGPNYPNPFNPSTSISYALPEEGNVTIEIFDLGGKVVYKENLGFHPRGYYTFQWNGETLYAGGLTSGVFILKLSYNGYAKQQKVLLLK
ncbi:T9SS type A sorting domain-containing protein [bacterium]|nr:T9SS type A sorting domain-containing protein [bacterium]